MRNTNKKTKTTFKCFRISNSLIVYEMDAAQPVKGEAFFRELRDRLPGGNKEQKQKRIQGRSGFREELKEHENDLKQAEKEKQDIETRITEGKVETAQLDLEISNKKIDGVSIDEPWAKKIKVDSEIKDATRELSDVNKRISNIKTKIKNTENAIKSVNSAAKQVKSSTKQIKASAKQYRNVEGLDDVLLDVFTRSINGEDLRDERLIPEAARLARKLERYCQKHITEPLAFDDANSVKETPLVSFIEFKKIKDMVVGHETVVATKSELRVFKIVTLILDHKLSMYYNQ